MAAAPRSIVATQKDHPLVVQALIDAGARSAEPRFDSRQGAHRGQGEGQPGQGERLHPALHRLPERQAGGRQGAHQGQGEGQPGHGERLHPALHRLPDGKLEVVKALIKAKAKVNQAKEDGCTPLYIASQLGKLEVVKALIEAKANKVRTIRALPVDAGGRTYAGPDVVAS